MFMYFLNSYFYFLINVIYTECVRRNEEVNGFVKYIIEMELFVKTSWRFMINL